jgi:tetratricopeptide (TPR) repeat protein
MGETDLARQLLAQVPDGFDSADYRFALAEFGDAGRAQALLRRDLSQSPHDTLSTQVFAAEQQAAAALRQARPADAVQALRPALPYERRTYDVPYLRAEAYMAAGDSAQAAAEFHKVVDNPGVEPVSVLYPLAELGLARAEARLQDVRDARAAYERVLAEWKDADPDLPPLRAARAEYARISAR